MDLIYPGQEFENRLLWVLWYKPPLYTILAPFLALVFLIGVGFIFVLIWFMGQVAFTVLSGGADSFSGFLAPALFIAVGVLFVFFAVVVNYRYYYFYTRDLIKIAMGENRLVLSKGFSDWDRTFDEIKRIRIEPDQTDRYYGEYHKIVIDTEDASSEEFILTIDQNYGGIPGLSFRLPSNSRRWIGCMRFWTPPISRRKWTSFRNGKLSVGGRFLTERLIVGERKTFFNRP